VEHERDGARDAVLIHILLEEAIDASEAFTIERRVRRLGKRPAGEQHERK
jgi:hypothetical protein